jgi:hypothetical protein
LKIDTYQIINEMITVVPRLNSEKLT